MRLFLIILIHFELFHMATMFEHSTRDGSEVLRSISQVFSDNILESLYKIRIHESDELKNRVGHSTNKKWSNISHSTELSEVEGPW